ncbi:MAG: hypothetical protein JWO09_1744 [Bacteroidetes bacterium]|nr:hypothetical protein [Bacteroidota bacterium]
MVFICGNQKTVTMKKVVQIFVVPIIPIIVFLFFTISCTGQRGRIKASKVEDSIQLEGHQVIRAAGESQMDLCHERIKMDSTFSLPHHAAGIRAKAFDTLEEIAYSFGPASAHYILALKINYGLDTTNKTMSLLYQPLLLDKDSTTTGRYLPKGNSTYYKYNTTFKRFEVATDISCLQLYKDRITFKRPGQKYFSVFDTTNDITGDVESLVFSFQEIKKIIDENKTEILYLCNAAEYVEDKDKVDIKHSILLGPDEITKTLIFYRKFANLSHLCPPSCNEHFYDLIHPH